MTTLTIIMTDDDGDTKINNVDDDDDDDDDEEDPNNRQTCADEYAIAHIVVTHKTRRTPFLPSRMLPEIKIEI